MITVLPTDDIIEKKQFFSKLYNTILTKGTQEEYFIIKDGKRILGYTAVDVFDIYTRIHKIDIINNDKKNLILDYIIRTIMSYSLNRNIFTIMCSNKEYFEDLKKNFFYEADSSVYLEFYKHMGCH